MMIQRLQRDLPRSCGTTNRRMTRDPAGLIDSFRRAGQGQVFAFFDRLSPDSKARLLSEAAEIDLGEIDRMFRTLVAGRESRAVDVEGLGPASRAAPGWSRRPARSGAPAPAGSRFTVRTPMLFALFTRAMLAVISRRHAPPFPRPRPPRPR